MPAPATIATAVAAGLAGVAGILSLYHGLAVGRMGVVAPVTGVLAATLPVVAGSVVDGLPDPPILVGIAAALVAVVLVSRSPGEAATRSGLEFGLVAGLAIGAFNILIGLLPEGAVFGPLVALKLAAAVGIALVAVLGRRAWRVPRALLPAVALVGVFDMGGNLFYVLATQSGRLDVAAILSSLYPVTTILLAIVLLRERVGRLHAVGIVTAAVAIALIAGGSTGT